MDTSSPAAPSTHLPIRRKSKRVGAVGLASLAGGLAALGGGVAGATIGGSSTGGVAIPGATGVTVQPDVPSGMLVTWTPPTLSTGTIASSIVTCTSPQGLPTVVKRQSGPRGSSAVTGLDAGADYQCSVQVKDSLGDTSAPTSSALFTADRLPLRLSGVHFTPGDQQITGSWGPLVPDGGSPVTEVTLTCWVPGLTPMSVSGISSPLTLTGLVNGAVYDCDLSGRSAVGNGSAGIVTVSPGSKPPAPTNVVWSSTTSSISATADSDTTTRPPVTSYVVSCTNTVTGMVSRFVQTDPAGPLGPLTVTPGKLYDCTLFAQNADGMGPGSPPELVLPGAPPEVTGVTEDTSGTTPSGAITLDYAAVSTATAATCTTTDSGAQIASATNTDPSVPSITVSGLTPGDNYSCVVVATNGTGLNSPASEIVTAQPAP